MNQKGITVTNISIGSIDSYFPHYTYVVMKNINLLELLQSVMI